MTACCLKHCREVHNRPTCGVRRGEGPQYHQQVRRHVLALTLTPPAMPLWWSVLLGLRHRGTRDRVVCTGEKAHTITSKFLSLHRHSPRRFPHSPSDGHFFFDSSIGKLPVPLMFSPHAVGHGAVVNFVLAIMPCQ